MVDAFHGSLQLDRQGSTIGGDNRSIAFTHSPVGTGTGLIPLEVDHRRSIKSGSRDERTDRMDVLVPPAAGREHARKRRILALMGIDPVKECFEGADCGPGVSVCFELTSSLVPWGAGVIDRKPKFSGDRRPGIRSCPMQPSASDVKGAPSRTEMLRPRSPSYTCGRLQNDERKVRSRRHEVPARRYTGCASADDRHIYFVLSHNGASRLSSELPW